MDRYPNISDHGLIGDLQTAALVATDGTIDWWCRGRFDADPLLRRLDDPRGPSVGITCGGGTGTQTTDAMVVRSQLAAGEQAIELTDLMPWEGRSSSDRIVRLVEARRGPATVPFCSARSNASKAAST